MIDEARQAAGRKGGAGRWHSIARCPYCNKRPPIKPGFVHGCLLAAEAMRQACVARVKSFTRNDNPADEAIFRDDNELIACIAAALETIKARPEEEE